MGMNRLNHISLLKKLHLFWSEWEWFCPSRHFRSIHLFLIIAGMFLMSCSSTSWQVVNEGAVDVNDYEITNTSYFLKSENGITPNQPLIHFDLKAVNTYEYAERVRTERYIQRYRPRLGYALLGAAGAGLSFYAAYSDQLISQPSNPQRYALSGAGVLLSGMSLLNMKPVGDPARTGESRLLRRTGTYIENDTVTVVPYDKSIEPSIRISYMGKVLAEQNQWRFNEGRITINLAETIDESQFEENPPDKILVEAFYDTLSSSKKVAISSIFERFVVVDAQITALRNEPANDRNNVLTDLAEGSQLKLLERNGDWYKVLYGISETWVAANDVTTIWRPSEFASDLSVIAIPNVPFGSVDVERDIPVLGRNALNTSALILANSQFEGDYSERIYGQRDARLMEEYFIQALGVRSSRVTKAMNVPNDRFLDRAYSRMVNTMSDESQTLFMYLNGYAEIRNSGVYLLGTELNEGEAQYIDLQKFFRALGNLNLNKLIVFVDLDFISNTGNTEAFEGLASLITNQDFEASVIFASRPDQQSAIFSSNNGEQNRHSIFTYYLASALKQGNVSVQDIFNYLERNIPFTSRSIYDRPQNPILYGDTDLRLVD
jgi:hypothetical protein